MTKSQRQSAGKNVYNMLDDYVYLMVSLAVWDKLVVPHLENREDNYWEHLAKQELLVLGVTESISFFRRNGWLPVLFGVKQWHVIK